MVQMSQGTAPQPKKTKLIVLAVFDRGEDGELVPAFEPREMPSEERAVREAREMATRHVGVIAWSRSADPSRGEFGDPVLLYQHGDVPEMD